jgi:hypothetical protein
MAAPSPSPAPPAPSLPAREILHSLSHGLWQAISSAPWIAPVLALLIISAVVRFVRTIIHNGPRDPIRLFTRTDKAVILARAGIRCEHHGWLTGRCHATDRLEADHVHPHARGGWTNLANGQALCQRHNRMKRATVPFDWQLRRLAKRRLSYFPADAEPTVIRRKTRRTSSASEIA